MTQARNPLAGPAISDEGPQPATTSAAVETNARVFGPDMFDGEGPGGHRHDQQLNGTPKADSPGRKLRPGEMPAFARSTGGPLGPADAVDAPKTRLDVRPQGVIFPSN